MGGIDEKYIAAFLNAGFCTTAFVAFYRGDGLRRDPRCDETFKRLMNKLHDKTAAIDVDGDDDLTTVSSIVTHCVTVEQKALAASAVVAPAAGVGSAIVASVGDIEKKREADIFDRTRTST